MSFSPSPTLAACSAHVICKPQEKPCPALSLLFHNLNLTARQELNKHFLLLWDFPLPHPELGSKVQLGSRHRTEGGWSAQRGQLTPHHPQKHPSWLLVGMEHRDAPGLGKAGGKLGWAGVHWSLPQKPAQKTGEGLCETLSIHPTKGE